jgi:hypothetical protein
MSTLDSPGTLAEIEAAYADGTSCDADNLVACRAFDTACRLPVLTRRAGAGTLAE